MCAQPPSSPGLPWGTAVEEFITRYRDGQQPSQVFADGSDTTIMYSDYPSLQSYVFGRSGLYSSELVELIDASDSTLALSLFDRARNDMIAASQSGDCTLSDMPYSDSTDGVVEAECPDGLTTKVSLHKSGMDPGYLFSVIVTNRRLASVGDL
jgi:hypothetical protein